ncbi:MAG: thioesterase family protein [Gammaproteobacteria bacterium]|nr:thioesterase family protein [Gammaproteobacteria bacterium]
MPCIGSKLGHLLPHLAVASVLCTPVMTSQKNHHLTDITKSSFKYIKTLTTRWSDNDIYGHVNNVAYYSWFDTTINAMLIENHFLNLTQGDLIGLMVHSDCDFLAPISYPQLVDIGVLPDKIGNSSVRYTVAAFVQEQMMALGHLVHVYVDRENRQPKTIPNALRSYLSALQ